jgi:hypothetical protein
MYILSHFCLTCLSDMRRLASHLIQFVTLDFIRCRQAIYNLLLFAALLHSHFYESSSAPAVTLQN